MDSFRNRETRAVQKCKHCGGFIEKKTLRYALGGSYTWWSHVGGSGSFCPQTKAEPAAPPESRDGNLNAS